MVDHPPKNGNRRARPFSALYKCPRRGPSARAGVQGLDRHHPAPENEEHVALTCMGASVILAWGRGPAPPTALADLPDFSNWAN